MRLRTTDISARTIGDETIVLSLRPPEMCRAVESKQSMIVKVGARW